MRHVIEKGILIDHQSIKYPCYGGALSNNNRVLRSSVLAATRWLDQETARFS